MLTAVELGDAATTAELVEALVETTPLELVVKAETTMEIIALSTSKPAKKLV